jgi:biotin transport system substrate-specific component
VKRIAVQIGGGLEVVAMSQEAVVSKQKNSAHVRDLVYIAVFAALMAILSWISITVPGATPVSFTLQTLGVFLSVGLLGGKRGTAAVTVYVLMGAIGLPVFAGFSGGVGALMGSSGGYIVGFILSALVMWGLEKVIGTKPVAMIVSMAVGLLVCYAFGTVWFMVVYGSANGAISLATALGWCVIPFIPFDAIKIALAFVLSNRLRPYVLR